MSSKRKRRVEIDRVYELMAIMTIAMDRKLTIPVGMAEEYNALLIKWHSEIISESSKK